MQLQNRKASSGGRNSQKNLPQSFEEMFRAAKKGKGKKSMKEPNMKEPNMKETNMKETNMKEPNMKETNMKELKVKQPTVHKRKEIKRRSKSCHALKIEKCEAKGEGDGKENDKSQAWKQDPLKDGLSTAATRQEHSFEEEYREVMRRLDHSRHQHLREVECFLSVEEIVWVLRSLGYLREGEFLYSIWNELQGETYGGVPSENLYELLQCINQENKRKPLTRVRSTGSFMKENSQKTVTIDRNLQLKLSDTQRRRLSQKYASLRLNRVERNTKKEGREQRKQRKEEQVSRKENDTNKENESVFEERVSSPKAILCVDVNLGQGVNEKLIVFEGESAFEVSRRLVDKYRIDESLRVRFETMLQSHLKNLLWKIEEVEEDMITDREI